MLARATMVRKPMRRVVTGPWAHRLEDNPSRAPPPTATNVRRSIESPHLHDASEAQRLDGLCQVRE